jgi:hypothetical protein
MRAMMPSTNERADVVGDGLALVHELGVGLDQPDELVAAHLLPPWGPGRVKRAIRVMM